MSADPLPPELEAKIKAAAAEIQSWYAAKSGWSERRTPNEVLRAFAREIQADEKARRENVSAIADQISRDEVSALTQLQESRQAGEALARYGKHERDCDFHRMGEPCTCGLWAALSSWRALRGEKP